MKHCYALLSLSALKLFIKRDKMSNITIAFIVFGAMALFLLVLVILSIVKVANIKRRAAYTLGTVVDFDQATNKLIVRYSINGTEIIAKSVILFARPSSSSVVTGIFRKTEYFIGKEIKVMFDRNRPKNILIDGAMPFYIAFSIAMTAAAAAAIAIPCMLYYVDKTVW